MRCWCVCWVGVHDGSKCERVYYTGYHAEQFARALRLNGVQNVTIVTR